MKTVNKYILVSCFLCYFTGLYIIIVKLGILRLISHYGIHRVFKEWPENFPSLTVVWIFLAIYTLLFILISYWIYRANERHAVKTDALQQKASTIHNYSERLSQVISQYNRICREKNISNKTLGQRLQLLQKQVAALPPAILDNGGGDNIARIVSELNEAIAGMGMSVENDMTAFNIQFGNLVERSLDEVQSIRSNSLSH